MKKILLKLKKIITDDSYKQIKREPYINTINLPHPYEKVPKLDFIEFEDFPCSKIDANYNLNHNEKK